MRALEAAARDAAKRRPAARCDQRRNRHLHHAGLRVPRRRPAGDELPFAEIDAADAGVRVRGHGDDPRSVSARDRRALSLLQLRRRDAAHAASGRPINRRLQPINHSPRICAGLFSGGTGASEHDDPDAIIHPPANGLKFDLTHHRRPGTSRPPHAESRRGRNADLHAGRHLRHGEGGPAARTGGNARADHPRQHVSPVAAPRAGDDRRARRPAQLHGLEAPDPHRLRRLPGVFAGRSAQDHRRWRHVRVADQRRQAVPVARNLDADPEGAELGHRDAVRRMHAVRDQQRADVAPGRRRFDAHVDALGAALHRRIQRPGQSERAVRHRPGRHVRGPARRVAGRSRRRWTSTASRSAACRSASRRKT